MKIRSFASGDHTITASASFDRAGVEGAAVDLPRLVLAMSCQRPLTPGQRVSLRGVEELRLARGRRRVDRAGRRATLFIEDEQMSRCHAVVRKVAAGWELVDAGSKNGMALNGERCVRAILIDGDVVEIGGTMLVFRESGPAAAGAMASDRDLADPAEQAAPAAFRTLALELERRMTELRCIATSNVTVLATGESGTGKELVARAIHELSGRPGPFVAINCGAIPPNLVESELFGYRRGAFSGARDDREGLVRRAHRGTLFLDEVAELPPESQVALLRVLQEGEVRPVGASDAIAADVRVVAATHQCVQSRIAAGRFREDLYARLAGFELTLPPLRDRSEDVGSLIASILGRLGPDAAGVTLHPATARALLTYSYPMNVRQLEQALRTAVVLCGGGPIRVEHLPEPIRLHRASTGAGLRPEDRAVRERLVEILRQTRGNVTAAGRAMGKAPIQVRRWCQRFAIDLASFRARDESIALTPDDGSGAGPVSVPA